MTENIEALVEQAEKDVAAAQGKGTFQLTNVLKRRGFPEEQVVVYLDEDSAHELVALNRQMETIARSPEKTDETIAAYNTLEALADEMAENVRNSALTFHLRGISPGHIEQTRKNIVKEFGQEPEDQQEADDALAHEWIAAHIIRVTNAEGAVDERLFKRADVEELEQLLPSSEYAKIDRTVNNLSFRSAYIEQATDAGFLLKS